MPIEFEKTEDYFGFKAHHFTFDNAPCIIVEPNAPRSDRRWVWKAEFFPAFPKFELEMLKRGYYMAYMNVGNTFGCPSAMKRFDKFYDLVTGEYDLHKLPVLLGLSRGGLYIYNWACNNPEKVGLLYADNPVCDFKSWPGGKGVGPGSAHDWEKLLKDYEFASEEEALAYPQPLDKVGILLQNNVPLLHVAAVDDEVVPFEENTLLMEKKVIELGGTVKVFRHPGGHHPHGLDEPAPVADYVEANMR